MKLSIFSVIPPNMGLMSATKVFFFWLLIFFACEKNITSIQPIPEEVGSIKGKITDYTSSLPIENAVINLTKNAKSDTTDSTGSYHMSDLKLGRDSLSIIANGFEPKLIPIEISPDSQTINTALDRVEENLYLYMGTFGGTDLFVVDVDSFQKVDSLYFAPGDMGPLTITPGGSRIYISRIDNQGVLVYYLDTISRTYHPTGLPNGVIRVNEDGTGIILDNDGFYKFDTLTHNVRLVDTLSRMEFMAFAQDKPAFLYARNNLLYTYDYQQEMIIDSLAIPSAWNKALTPDNRELYYTSSNGLLSAMNIESEEIYEIGYVHHPSGRIAFTPDGKIGFVSDPGSNLPPTPSSGLLTVFNTESHQLENYIDLRILGGYISCSFDIVVTPSSNYAFTNCEISNLFMIDVRKREVIKSLKFLPYSATLRFLVLGRKYNPS